jgi:hypothetical protein
MSKPECWYCKFYMDIGEKGSGECHRHAPSPGPSAFFIPDPDRDRIGPFEARWPEVEDDDWCGEHQPRPRPEDQP